MKIATVLLCLALIQVVSATVVSLEEGDFDAKRTFKWILDPMSPLFPLPRFPMVNGVGANPKEFRFLATLDCSRVPANAVAVAVYDPVIDDWNCTSTGMLPNDTFTPSGNTSGLPFNCSRNLVAVWNHTTTEWDCSFREALLFQSQPLIAENLCRSQDLLTINYDTSDIYIDRPAGLCVPASSRQVGPDASVGKRTPFGIQDRNIGDPDEAFYIQSTSKAIGGIGSTGGSEHFKWQYWAWSPIRTSFASSVGSYPPLLAVDGAHLVAVTANTYSLSSNIWTLTTHAVNFKVVKVYNVLTGTYPTITYMQYKADDFTTTLISPVSVIYSNTSSIIPSTALAKGNALSIYITSVPAGLTGQPKTVWFAVSLWVSTIQKEV